jgi:hypothetical protein
MIRLLQSRPSRAGNAFPAVGESDDRGIFAERGIVWQPKVGAGQGIIEEVPAPWFDRVLLRWFPHVALSRAQARAALRRLDEQRTTPPGTVTVRRWDHATQRWQPAVPPPPASVLRDRRW